MFRAQGSILNWVLGTWVIVTVVQVLGKYMVTGYSDPLGKLDVEP